MGPKTRLFCNLCGQAHQPVPLKPGEEALCARCGAVLAQGSRLGRPAALAFAITGLIFAPPAALLTFVSAGKLGATRHSLLFTGVGSLWEGGMRSLAVLVLLLGGLIPFALLVTLASIHWPIRLSRKTPNSRIRFQVARLLGHWAIPEVQVLAVLVAFMKLRSVVDIKIGPGFWCYSAMALSLLVAQRSVNFAATSLPDDCRKHNGVSST